MPTAVDGSAFEPSSARDSARALAEALDHVCDRQCAVAR